MELQQLKYFRAVAEKEHVTRAAELMFVSQSAVSRAVTQLEEELGVPLFHRRGRSLVLSDYGRLFLDHVVRAEAILSSGTRLLQEQTGAETGTVTLGFLHSLGVTLIPGLVHKYRLVHPQTKFTLVQLSGEVLLQNLLDGQIDLCFSVPGMFDNSTVHWSPLQIEVLVAVLPQTHRLAHRRTLRLAELSTESFVALSHAHTLRRIFDKACSDASFIPNVTFEATDIATLRGMIAAGIGIGILPTIQSRMSGVVQINLSQPRPTRQIGMGWISGRYIPPCALEFRKFIQSMF